MSYGIKLKKYDRIVRGFHGTKSEAEAMKKKYEERGIKAQIVSFKGSSSKLDKVA
jgi:hypothetical protein